MTYLLLEQKGGESRDAIMEHPSQALASSAVTVISTAARVVAPGTRALSFPTNTSATPGTKAIVKACGADTNLVGPIYVFSGYLGLSGTLSSAVGVLQAETKGGARYIRINTSGCIELYDSGGVQVGPSGFTPISTTGMTHFEISYDLGAALAPPIDTAWISVKVGGILQWEGLAQASTASFLIDNREIDLHWGEWLPDATARGADLFGTHLVARKGSSRATDHPCQRAYEIIHIVGGASRPPAANGSQTGWTLGVTTFDYQEVDEYANDGDTSWVGETANGAKETYQSTAANPLTSADTPLHVVQRVVHRVTSGGKAGNNALYRDGSGNESQGAYNAPGTTYVGASVLMTRPAGGDYVYTDFDNSGGESTLEFGGITAAAGTIGARWTSLPGPEISFSNTRNIFSRGPE